MRVLILSAGLSLALLAGMMVLDRALKTPAAPAGILSFEVAGSPAAARHILSSWDAGARIQAGISLGLDFFFLASYAFTLSLACRTVAARLPPKRYPFGIMGRLLAWAAWFAALLDVVENLALIQLLLGRGRDWHPVLAAWCAWPKFGITAAILLYLFAGGVVLFLNRVRVPTSS